jgi:hypothetical protein
VSWVHAQGRVQPAAEAMKGSLPSYRPNTNNPRLGSSSWLKVVGLCQEEVSERASIFSVSRLPLLLARNHYMRAVILRYVFFDLSDWLIRSSTYTRTVPPWLQRVRHLGLPCLFFHSFIPSTFCQSTYSLVLANGSPSSTFVCNDRNSIYSSDFISVELDWKNRLTYKQIKNAIEATMDW